MARFLMELAAAVSGQLQGAPELLIERIAPLERAQTGELAFVSSAKNLKRLAGCQAAAVILKPEWRDQWSGNALLVENPYLAYAQIASLLDSSPVLAAEIHPTAVIGPDSQLGQGVRIGPNAVIGAGAVIGDGCWIGAGSVIGDETVLGEDCRLGANVTLYHRVRLGNRVSIQSGAVLGAEGFGYARDGSRWVKIPHTGSVVLGDDVEVGANCTIDRGALDDTILHNGVKIDNLVHIAHNCVIGEDSAFAAFVGIAGSTKVGRRCTFSGSVGVAGHIEICDDVHMTGMSIVPGNIQEPGVYSSGTDMMPNALWRKNAVRFKQLDDMARRLKKLEQQLAVTAKQE